MAHFIVRVPFIWDGDQYVDGVFYAYHRRSTGRVYERETHFGPDIEQARVYPTRAAATNSVRNFYDLDKVEVLPVKLTVQDLLDLAKGITP